MAQKTLTTSYLVKLTNANHDGVTQQICDRLRDFETENQMLLQAVEGVRSARQTEDTAYRRYSGKDFASDDLRAADGLEDKYMSTIHNLLNALLYLPETEPMRRKAQVAVQLFKDFQFSTSDGMEAEARKTINMVQQWTGSDAYDLAGLGIQEWVAKAQQQAAQVLALVAQRVENESQKVKGELAAARKATDQAIRQAYDILNALMVLQPSAALTQMVGLLLSIEERAQLYYISGGTVSGGDKPTPSGETTQGGTSGGGTSTEGGSGSGGSSSGSGTGSITPGGGSSSGDNGGSTGGSTGGSGGGDNGDE
ncbi:MAG: hypothetical protein J6B97_10350 [Bacteroidales bacterium]|nr:hypothetical protein [Bacteroidales bacterium]